jgi:hypothetical protein
VTKLKSKNKFDNFYLTFFFSKLVISFHKKKEKHCNTIFPFYFDFSHFGEISHRKETLAERPGEIRHQAISITSTSIRRYL